ncbi:Pimeloyl-ACP methyl ester carboxylesterase [Roseivivax lentus]|uniref:Pimeloyl-ACP methyl ester carboxylesterase n=1 Tax=Roseivivax lentus TaxID=633194 RepID=A0A1N7NYA0_9RHOB|nr:alpha/beta hydrolase [Roseivivax lentus]SIT03256.1 Pimeloyl-ACP methyl ester carboxylesterase [Roseivivax lentus]
MPTLTTDDAVTLYYEEVGQGTPVLFVHEFAGDCRSWEPQMRYFSRRYRCIAFNARGWPPSEVPEDPAKYSQARATADVVAILDGLGIDRAHVVGLSMGGYATLHLGLTAPERALSLVVSGVGYGAERERQALWRAEADASANRLRSAGMKAFAEDYAQGPTRVQFQNKDPRGWREFADRMAEHSAAGSARTQQQVQRERPSIYDLEDGLRAMTTPCLILNGDEDWPCSLPGVFMKAVVPSAQLQVVPGTGHTVNLEEPDLFNTALEKFFAQVDAGRWPLRDPRAVSDSITGVMPSN